MVQTGKTFRDAAEEWLAYCENVRDCKPSTMRDYRNMVRVLDREFGDRKIETITSEDIELWVERLRRLQPDPAEVPRLPRLDLQAGDEGLRPAAQPRRRRRATAGAPRGEDRRAAPRGGPGARRAAEEGRHRSRRHIRSGQGG